MSEAAPHTHLPEASFYHVCFAVPDLRAAMAELTELLGVHFNEPVHDQLGEWPYSLVITTAAPHIELISSVKGSPWEAATPTFHHLGWWSSCLDHTVDAWTNTGTIHFDGRKEGRRFAYIDAPHSGLRLEAVDASQRADFLHRWMR